MENFISSTQKVVGGEILFFLLQTNPPLMVEEENKKTENKTTLKSRRRSPNGLFRGVYIDVRSHLLRGEVNEHSQESIQVNINESGPIHLDPL